MADDIEGDLGGVSEDIIIVKDISADVFSSGGRVGVADEGVVMRPLMAGSRGSSTVIIQLSIYNQTNQKGVWLTGVAF